MGMNELERLTKRAVSVGGIYKTCCTHFRSDDCWKMEGRCDQCRINDRAWDRLAAYEDSGYSPKRVMELVQGIKDIGKICTDRYDEIQRLKDELRKVSSRFGSERMYQLALAESEGRAEILPVALGGRLWQVTEDEDIIEWLVDMIEIKDCGDSYISCVGIVDDECDDSYESFDVVCIGEKLKRTREEAEAELTAIRIRKGGATNGQEEPAADGD